MADINDIVQNSMVTVGPSATSGSGSLRDQSRERDVGQASSLTLTDVKALKPPKAAKLNSMEKAFAFQSAAEGAAAAMLEGKSPDDVSAAAGAGFTSVTSNPTQASRTKPIGAPKLPANPASDAHFAEAEADAKRQMEYKSSVSLSDSFKAAYNESTVTSAFTRLAIDTIEGNRDFQSDPTFDPLQGREEWGARMSQEDLEYVADSRSAAEREWKLGRLQEMRDNYKAMGVHGEGVSTILGLSAGILDPAGWAAGMGVGKLAQMGRLGANLPNIARVSAAAAEGAVGNLAAMGLIEAAGDHVTPGDYFTAAAFGAVFSGGIASARRSAGPVRDQNPVEDLGPATEAYGAVQAASQSLNEGNIRYSAGLLDEAAGRLPEDATGAQIAAEARNVYNERSNEFFRAGTAPLDDSQRILPNFDFETLYGQTRPDADGNITSTTAGSGMAADDLSPFQRNQLREAGFTDPEIMELSTNDALTLLGEPELGRSLTTAAVEGFRDVAQRKVVGDLFNITPDTVPDNAKRLMFQEILLRTAENPVVFDQAKLQTLIGKYVAPLADSKMVANFSMPQHILARSEHPVMRWVAAHLTESPTQAGGPRMTAAVEHTVRERNYNSYIARYLEAYRAFRDQNGGSGVRDTVGKGEHFEQFNILVSEARNNRAAGIDGNEHPHIARAADAMDEGYTHMRLDQTNAKTLGSMNLPTSSRGYTPRHINSRWLEADPLGREALRKEIRQQLTDVWGDFTNGHKLAAEVSATYINRARYEGAGGVSVPGHMADPAAHANIRDALLQHAVSEKDADKYIKRLTRGGASQTKHRLDLDLSKELVRSDGTTFRMSEAFVMDQTALFRQQARRVNGEVTLARRGIMGQKGVDELRELVVLSKERGDSAKWKNELDAFDQVMSEFLGRPYGTTSKLADNTRILVGASRLGQAVIPQAAETASLASQLGTESAMRFVQDLPRLVTEVRTGKTNDLLHSLELPGGAIGDNHKYVVPWQSFDDVQLAGREADSAMGRVVRGAANAQFTLTGHRYLLAAQVRGTSEQILHKVFRYVKDDVNHPALKSMGMTPQLAAALRRDLTNIAEFDNAGKLTALDVRQSADPQAMHNLIQVVERGAKQIIQDNFIGERQAYLHSSMLRLMAQFRSYSLTAMSKQWTRTRVDHGTAKAVGLLMGQMSFALPLHMARVSIAASLMSDQRKSEYLEQQMAPDMLGRATLNYATLSGSLGDILDAGLALGGVEAAGVRTGNSSVLGNVPALGYITNTVQALKDKDMSGLIKAAPGGNSIFLLPAVNFTHWMQKED